jgi:lysophospholipase L1-like esterase
MNPGVSKLALILTATAATLGVAEAGLRVLHPVPYRRPPAPLPDSTWRELLHRPSSVPGLPYELTPGRETYARGAPIRTNSFGMRDDEPRDRAVRRIVALGDSFTFGFGVRGEDTYPNVLERLLEGAPGVFEVLNLGVGGYSTRDEAIVFEHKALQWNPELAIVGYVLNDPEIDPDQPLQSHYQQPRWWQHVNLLRLAAQAKHALDVRISGNGDYFRYLHAPRGAKWRSVLEAFARIAATARARGIAALVVIFPFTRDEAWEAYPYRDLHDQVSRAARERGLHVLDLLDAFSRHPPRELMAGIGDGHPSTLGHEIAARAIRDWMAASGQLAGGAAYPR